MRAKMARAFTIRNSAELWRYVARTTTLCVVLALTVDVANQLIFFESWGAAIRSWCITVGVVIAVAVPVSCAMGRAYLSLYLASRTDPLTGLLNRRALLEGVDEPPNAMVLLIVDIDRFKSINDTHGHLVGDEVLRSIAAMMGQDLGPIGRVGRLGGEEFALLTTGREGLLDRLEAFRKRVETTPVDAGPGHVSVTISAGVAARDDGQSFEQLYIRADRALYMAKAGGRNRIVRAEELDARLQTTAAAMPRPAARVA